MKNKIMIKLTLLLIIFPLISLSQNLNKDEVIQILTAHNKYRSNLELSKLSWSKDLAMSSQKWANILMLRNAFEHSNTKNGENLYIITGSDATPTEVVDSWASEKKYFNYKTRKCVTNCCDLVDCCQHECGHYTQIIWRDTKEVGCAVSKLGIKQIWVCQYNPAGNYVGKKTY